MRRYFTIVLIIALTGVTYFTTLFIQKQRSFDENLRLNQENENLRAQIQKLTTNDKQPMSNSNYLTAEVFSNYPFNTKNQITIDVGEKQGIQKNMAVILGDNILVGKIINVFGNSSLVQTVFDPNWQLPVRIGQQETDGLFQGGNEPKVVLIEKEKPVQINDAVYSAGQDFPYGLKVADIAQIEETPAGVFKEAVLKMPFNVNELREVNVLK